MNHYEFDGMRRISKREARKLFDNNQEIILVGCKLRPGKPWNPEFHLTPDSIKQWKEKALGYSPEGFLPDSQLWKGNVNETAWQLMYNNWAYYNTGEGMGNYASYYVTIVEAAPVPQT